mmetsp:Transcript_10217/g.20448  ORF Transcript_10217/g.20448 Transcript_10217/m.20448 type:complete len:248 (-) Transcript_10217:17-760(-)
MPLKAFIPEKQAQRALLSYAALLQAVTDDGEGEKKKATKPLSSPSPLLSLVRPEHAAVTESEVESKAAAAFKDVSVADSHVLPAFADTLPPTDSAQVECTRSPLGASGVGANRNFASGGHSIGKDPCSEDLKTASEGGALALVTEDRSALSAHGDTLNNHEKVEIATAAPTAVVRGGVALDNGEDGEDINGWLRRRAGCSASEVGLLTAVAGAEVVNDLKLLDASDFSELGVCAETAQRVMEALVGH